jgi:plastocyanin
MSVGIASGFGIAPLTGAPALAATAHVLAYGPLASSGPGPCNTGALCWYPSDFHINSGDQVIWAVGSGNHGLQQLSTGAPWPSDCPKDQKYPTCKFSNTGVYRFQCSVHHEQMSGSITVDFLPPQQQQGHPPPPAATGATGAVPPAAAPAPGQTNQAVAPSASSSADPASGDTSSNNPISSSSGNSVPLILGLVALLSVIGAAVYFYATRNRA